MTTISIKLPDDLKKRVERLMKHDTRTAHAFMIDAISHATEREELRREFLADAKQAGKNLERDSKVYDLDAALDYIEARIMNGKAKRPRALTARRME